MEYYVSPNKLDLLGVQLEKSPTAASQEPGGFRKRIQNQETVGLSLVLLQLFSRAFSRLLDKKNESAVEFRFDL